MERQTLNYNERRQLHLRALKSWDGLKEHFSSHLTDLGDKFGDANLRVLILGCGADRTVYDIGSTLNKATFVVLDEDEESFHRVEFYESLRKRVKLVCANPLTYLRQVEDGHFNMVISFMWFDLDLLDESGLKALWYELGRVVAYLGVVRVFTQTGLTPNMYISALSKLYEKLYKKHSEYDTYAKEFLLDHYLGSYKKSLSMELLLSGVYGPAGFTAYGGWGTAEIAIIQCLVRDKERLQFT